MTKVQVILTKQKMAGSAIFTFLPLYSIVLADKENGFRDGNPFKTGGEVTDETDKKNNGSGPGCAFSFANAHTGKGACGGRSYP